MHQVARAVTATIVDGLLKRIEDEVRAERSRHAPADNASREHVDDEGDVDDNAAKYSPTCKTIWVAASAANGHAEVSVRDQGVGIPPEDHQKIFEKFVRGANAVSVGARGTGLGLAMVQRIMADHGANVRVDSRLGAGSTFTLVLPAATSQS